VAQLIVRNLEDSLVDALKQRAAQHGRSAEAEHREILRTALQSAPRASLLEHLLRFPDVGEDVDFEAEATPCPPARRVEL